MKTKIDWSSRRVQIAALISVVILLRLPVFFDVPGHDSAIFATIGRQWSQGHLPYLTAWDHKPPGVFAVNGLVFTFFPASLTALRALQVLWQIATALLFWNVAGRLFSRPSAWGATLLFAYLSNHLALIRHGNFTEEYLLIFHLGAWLLIWDRPSLTRLMGAGILIGLASLFKPPALMYLGPLWYYAAQKGKWSWKTWLPAGLVLFLSALTPWIITGIYFWSQGGWYAFWEANILINFFYVGAGSDRQSLGFILSSWFKIFRKVAPFAVIPWAVAYHAWKKGGPWPALVLVFVVDVVFISLGGNYYSHYFLVATISGTLLSWFAIEIIYTQQKEIGGRWKWGWGLIVLSFVPGLLREGKYIRDVVAQRRPHERYDRMVKVVDKVRQLTDESDSILVWGRQPIFAYILSPRRPASRYFHKFPLCDRRYPHMVTPRRKGQFFRDLEKTPPKLIIIQVPRGIPATLDRLTETLPEMKSYLKPHFHLDSRLYRYQFWVRKNTR